MAPENQPDEPNALLMRMARQTQAFMPLFQRAEAAKASNDFDAAGAAYDQLIVVSREHLATALRFNEIVAAASPLKPTAIEPIVRPLLNALRVQADIRQAQGRLPEAERLRAEALALGRAHLDEAGQAESERSHASSLVVQGRFNEALAALGAARDLFERQSDAIMQARVTIDMVDILQWLGDGERAAAELQRAADLVAHGWPAARRPTLTWAWPSSGRSARSPPGKATAVRPRRSPSYSASPPSSTTSRGWSPS